MINKWLLRREKHEQKLKWTNNNSINIGVSFKIKIVLKKIELYTKLGSVRPRIGPPYGRDLIYL